MHNPTRTTPRWRGWVPLVILPWLAWLAAPPHWAAWVKMWALAFVIYACVKWLTWRRAAAADAPGDVPAWRHAAYLLAWPGLDAEAFLLRPAAREPTRPEWCFAIAKLALGLTLFFAIARLAPPDSPMLAGWIGMVGIVFTLHFGLFHVLSCAWRARKIDAPTLMNWPLAAATVSEFWGRRWNAAFRDLTHRFLFRPLASRLGASGAGIVGFAFSGLVHDAVISLPARGGWGEPTAYFLLQGSAILFERSGVGKSLGLGNRQRIASRLFTAAVLIVPLPLLFHRPFVLHIILPFMHDAGAL